MFARLFFYILSGFASAVFLTACDDNTASTQSSISGRWELFKGFRNQKETETLSGVFFQFGTDGKMQTNLPVGAEAPTVYELERNEIHQKSPQEVTYFIESVTDTTLVLALEMRGMQFEMHLKKAVPAPEPLPQDSLTQPADSLSE